MKILFLCAQMLHVKTENDEISRIYLLIIKLPQMLYLFGFVLWSIFRETIFRKYIHIFNSIYDQIHTSNLTVNRIFKTTPNNGRKKIIFPFFCVIYIFSIFAMNKKIVNDINKT